MELVIILVIALMIFGAGKLPEVGSALGRGIKEFKKATTEIEDKITGDDTPERPSHIPTTAQQTQAQPSEHAEVREAR
jgi:sec-independent protein translocase protein TatA